MNARVGQPLSAQSCRGIIAALASLVSSALIATPAPAQDAGDFTTLTLDDLRPPLSPAFVLLGVEPATVQRPTTSRGLSTAFLSLVGEKQGVPRNFALETTPFWLVSRPAFAFEDYYSHDKRWTETLARTVKRSSALSLGTTPRTLLRDTIGTSIGLGYRNLLWPGRASDNLLRLKAAYVRELGKCADLEPTSKIEECRQKLLKSPLRDTLRLSLEPVGWKVQLAGGISAAFPHDTVQRGRIDRAGVWLSPSYRTDGGFEFILLTRYLSAQGESVDGKRSGYLDNGLRLLWTPVTPLALSIEAAARHVTGGSAKSMTSTRYGSLIEYRASSDMYIFYALGKDFAAARLERNRLLSTIGLNIGYGPKPIVRVDK